MLHFCIYSKHDNWFSLKYACRQAVTLETVLNWTKKYFQFTISWLVGSSVACKGCDTRMVLEEHRVVICFYSSPQLTNSLHPEHEGRGFLLESYSHTSPTWFPKSPIAKRTIYQSQEKIKKLHNKNWRINVRSPCHFWGRETEKNSYQKNIFPQKSSHINFLFKIPA